MEIQNRNEQGTTPSQQNIRASVAAAAEELGRLINLLHKRFGSQLPHDVFSNLPTGVAEVESLPSHSVRLALVAAIGEYLNWDVLQVSRLAAEILEDSNVHHLAKLIYEQIQNYGDDEPPA